jgi:hypothetical protein
MASINITQIKKTIIKEFSKPQISLGVFLFTQRQLKGIVNEYLKEFDEHPVTIELQSGAEDPEGTPNVTNTLERVGGNGFGSPNLFSFIGFNEGQDPTAPLRRLIEKTDIKRTTRKPKFILNYVVFSFPLRLPTEKDIDDAAPMPFKTTGRSWVNALESGEIPNINAYIYGTNHPNSRSGGGILAKRAGKLIAIRQGASFKNIDYTSPILKRLRLRLTKGVQVLPV